MKLSEEIESMLKNKITQEWLDERVDWIIKNAAEYYYRDLRDFVISKVKSEGESGKQGYYDFGYRSEVAYGDYLLSAKNIYIHHTYGETVLTYNHIVDETNYVYGHLVESESDVDSCCGGITKKDKWVRIFEGNDSINIEVILRADISYETDIGFWKSKTLATCHINSHIKKLVSYIADFASEDGISVSKPYLLCTGKDGDDYYNDHLTDGETTENSLKKCFVEIKYSI